MTYNRRESASSESTIQPHTLESMHILLSMNGQYVDIPNRAWAPLLSIDGQHADMPFRCGNITSNGWATCKHF